MKAKIILFLKGLAMGAADVVPGVSGGTIAFISGIYEELLTTIKSLDVEAIRLFLSGKWGAFWHKINGGFLFTLLAGIGTAIASMAKLILYLLDNQPVLIWSFFFGLVVASAVLVAKQVNRWTVGVWLAFVIGAVGAYFITGITTIADESTNPFYLFVCGAVAICAMILPGISGSFILLLMGAYHLVIGAVKGLVESLLHFDMAALFGQLKIVLIFGAGCIVGITTFSRVLSWLFKHYHDVVVALLIGFLLGSLRKVWPWKEVLEQVEKFKIDTNVLPARYAEVSGQDPQLFWAVLLAIVGFSMVYGLEKLAENLKNKA